MVDDLGSDHLPILTIILLSPVFRPKECPPSVFRKLAEVTASYFDSQINTRLSPFYAATLFTSLTLNAAKSSIPFGRIKRHFEAWWSAEVEVVVSERPKAFAAAHRSDEDSQAYISAS